MNFQIVLEKKQNGTLDITLQTNLTQDLILCFCLWVTELLIYVITYLPHLPKLYCMLDRFPYKTHRL